MQRKEIRICNQDISLLQPNEVKQSKEKTKQEKLGKKSRPAIKISPFRATKY
jgi:hypothetical protein